MFKDNLEDTICAISTAQGEGGIGIVRVSGRRALAIADKIFSHPGKEKPSGFKSYSMHYGKIVNNGKIIDEVILSVMRKPKSYTREDVVEINCHGGALPLRQVLELALESGARMACPGEFTKRAFLNGRIDLAQAEAVIDIIRAKTDSALKVSLEQLSGGLSKEINKIRKNLVDVLVGMDAAIDFPEEAIEQKDRQKILTVLDETAKNLNRLLDGSSSARMLREGIHTVICGLPNVGKSSLLNALLKKERSIVTSVPGTTRDAIEESLDIRGIPVKIVDTAGILKPRDLIEKKAVLRSRERIKQADLIIIMFDSGRRLCAGDFKLIKEVKNKKTIAVINKIDLKPRIEKEKISKLFSEVVEVCAKKSKGIGLLENAFLDFVYKGKLKSPEFMLVSNLRHIRALKDAKKMIDQAKSALTEKLPPEFIAQDLKDACVHLDVILGRSFPEEILERIFADFCIGK